MATKKYVIQQKQASGEPLTLHPETDADIVKVDIALPAPAHIFKAAGHELLPVEVIGGIPGAPQDGGGVIQHLRHRLRAGDG